MKKIEPNELKSLLDRTTKSIEDAKDNIAINAIVESLIKDLLNSEYASVWLYNDAEATLFRERSDDKINSLSMLDQKGILAKTFLTLSGGIYNYLASEKDYLPHIDNPDEIRMKSKILMPLLDGEGFLGIVTAYNSVRHIQNFDEEDMEALEALVPYLCKVVYRMCPEKRSKDSQVLYSSERLKSASNEADKKIQDIQKEKKEQATSDEMLNFLANTVHDIRTPSNALYGFLELLEEQAENQRLLQYIKKAKESAQFINELTTSILDRVSTQKERQTFKAKEINPVKFFADIAEIFSANMFNKKIQYQVYVDPLIPHEITIESDKLRRVIMNLIGNAYKFTPSNKAVDFSVRYDPADKQLTFSVADTGIGIAEESQKKIFEAFQQAEADTATKYGGTGLGLSIGAQYVKELGGTLELESELEKGSNFFFSIPTNIVNNAPTFAPINDTDVIIAIIMDDNNLLAAKNIMRYLVRFGIPKNNIRAIKSVSTALPETSHLLVFQHKLDAEVNAFVQNKRITTLIMEEDFLSMLNVETSAEFSTIASQYGFYGDSLYALFSSKTAARILIADDDRINIELIQAILEKEFCKVEVASDGEIAYQMLKKGIEEGKPFAAAFLDNYMPHRSGDEVMLAIRDLEKQHGSTPIYAVSISGDPKQNAEEKSFYNAFVGKPFKKKEIKETLANIL